MTKFFSIFAATIFATSAMAQDALYDDPLPQDAAFVRAIGLEMTQFFGVDVPADLGEDYAVLTANSVEGIEPGQYVTLLAYGTVLIEAERGTGSKVLVQFLNLTEATASLALADNSVTIIGDIAVNSIGAREVNPVKLPMAAYAGDAVIGEAFELTLERGKNPTIIADASGSRVLISEVIRTDLD